MKKRLLLVLLLIICIVTNVSAHEKFSDGWHTVKNVNKTNACNLNYVWGYYKNGKEEIRLCILRASHRGWGTKPENSIAGIIETKKQGYYGVEIDVRFTSDGIPVLLHDSKINRVARLKGNITKDLTKESDIYVKNYTLKDINSKYVFPINRDGKYLSEYKKNQIATFEEAVKTCKNNGLYMVIDLKAGNQDQITKLVDILKKNNMLDQVRWTSTHYKLLKYVTNKDNSARINLNTTSKEKCSTKITENCCNPNDPKHPLYCGTSNERKWYRTQIKTKSCFTIVDDVDANGNKITADKLGCATSGTVTLPSDPKDKYATSKYKLTKINKGTISLNTKSVTIASGKEQTIGYTYNGDGVVKCKSADNNYATCSVNTKNKNITIKGLKAKSSLIVNVYATQGTKLSATDDYQITVKITSSTTYPKGDVNGDNKVNAVDFVSVRSHIWYIKKLPNGQKLNDSQIKRADVNNNGVIDSVDFVTIKGIIYPNLSDEMKKQT